MQSMCQVVGVGATKCVKLCVCGDTTPEDATASATCVVNVVCRKCQSVRANKWCQKVMCVSCQCGMQQVVDVGGDTSEIARRERSCRVNSVCLGAKSDFFGIHVLRAPPRVGQFCFGPAWLRDRTCAWRLPRGLGQFHVFGGPRVVAGFRVLGGLGTVGHRPGRFLAAPRRVPGGMPACPVPQGDVLGCPGVQVLQ